MRKFQRMRTIAAIGLIGSTIIFAQPALADEHTVRIGGHVPITCEASLTGGVAEIDQTTFKLATSASFAIRPSA